MKATELWQKIDLTLGTIMPWADKEKIIINLLAPICEKAEEYERQRDDYYDELLKLRRQKVEIIEWLQEEASRCRECAKTGYDAYEIGTFEGQYEQAKETIEKIKAMEE